MDTLPLGRAMSQATPEGPSTLKQQEIMPLHKVLTRSHLEAFSWDSSLVNEDEGGVLSTPPPKLQP